MQVRSILVFNLLLYLLYGSLLQAFTTIELAFKIPSLKLSAISAAKKIFKILSERRSFFYSTYALKGRPYRGHLKRTSPQNWPF